MVFETRTERWVLSREAFAAQTGKRAVVLEAKLQIVWLIDLKVKILCEEPKRRQCAQTASSTESCRITLKIIKVKLFFEIFRRFAGRLVKRSKRCGSPDRRSLTDFN